MLPVAKKKTLTYKISTQPGKRELFTFGHNEIMAISRVDWSYSIPSSVRDDYGWPKQPLCVTIDDICQNEISSPLLLTRPLILENISGSVFNPSSIAVDLILNIYGDVFSHTGDFSRDQLALFAALPQEQLLPLMLGSSKGSLPMLTEQKPQLSNSDQFSMLSGDLFLASTEGMLSPDKVVALAKYLLDKGWQR